MRRFSLALTLVLACLLATASAATAPGAAEEEGYTLQVPVAASLESLAGKDKTLTLLEFAGSGYTLALTRLDDNGARWVRMVVARGNFFYGACTLGAWEQLEGLETMRVDAVFQPNRVEFAFTSLPDKQRRGALAMPMALGAPALSEFAEAQGIMLAPRADAEEKLPEESEPAAPAQSGGVSAGVYALALGLLVLLLAALILGQMFGRKWRIELRERFGQLARLARGYRAGGARGRAAAQPAHMEPEQARAPAYDSTEDNSARIFMDTSEFAGAGRQAPIVSVKPLPQEPLPREPVLAGVTVISDAGPSTLLRRILMKEETPPPAENQEEAMRAFFLGRARLPRYRFLTVGLSNRDALLELGGESVRPLFAPNPRGQMFSLEEESGSLYPHVEYFAPPSFVLQSALLSVCPARIFTFENQNGGPVTPDEAVNHSFTDIIPARTMRTEAGFIVTEKGRLVIGRT